MYRHFENFVAPARAKNELWRLIVGLTLFGVLYALLAVLYFLAVGFLVGIEDAVAAIGSPAGLATEMGAMVVLGSFFAMAAAVVVVTRLLHKRSFATLMGRGSVVVRDFVSTFLVFTLVAGISTGLWLSAMQPETNMDPGRWFSLLPFALILIAIQTLAEELVFRGYIQQQLAARFSSFWVWLVLPGVIFGIAHFDPSIPIMTSLTIIAVISVFGVIAADLTARTGSIGAAWGFHFGNNIFALTILSLEGSITGLALFTTPFSSHDTDIPFWAFGFDALAIVVTWLLCRRILSRRRAT